MECSLNLPTLKKQHIQIFESACDLQVKIRDLTRRWQSATQELQQLRRLSHQSGQSTIDLDIIRNELDAQYSNNISRIENTLREQYENSINQLRVEIDALNQHIARLDDDKRKILQKTQTVTMDNEQTITNHLYKISQLNLQLDQQNIELQKLVDTRNDLHDTETELSETAARHQYSMDVINKELQQVQIQLNNTKQDLVKTNTNYTNAQDELKTCKKSIQPLTEDISKLKQQLKHELTEFENQLTEANEEYTTGKKRMVETIQDLTEQLNVKIAKANELNQNLVACDQEHTKYEELQAQLIQVQSQLSTALASSATLAPLFITQANALSAMQETKNTKRSEVEAEMTRNMAEFQISSLNKLVKLTNADGNTSVWNKLCDLTGVNEPTVTCDEYNESPIGCLSQCNHCRWDNTSNKCVDYLRQ